MLIEQFFKIGIFFFLTVLMPFGIGCFALGIGKKKIEISNAFVYGFVIIWAIMQLITIPFIYLKVSLSVLAGILISVYSLIFLFAVIKYRREIADAFVRLWKNKTKDSWLIIVCCGLIAFHTFSIMTSALGDLDDSFYVAQAETAVKTNTIMEYDPYTGDAYGELPSRYVLSPFPTYVAFLSWFSGFSSAAIAHTFLPGVLFILAYIVYYLISKTLFEKDLIKQGVFLLFVITILSNSYFSRRTQGVFMYTRIWQGKGTLVAILIPLLVYWGIVICQNKMKKVDWWLLTATLMSACFVSSMGIMLGAIVIGILGIANLVVNKNWKEVFYMALCCAPNILYSLIYIVIR